MDYIDLGWTIDIWRLHITDIDENPIICPHVPFFKYIACLLNIKIYKSRYSEKNIIIFKRGIMGKLNLKSGLGSEK